ncbi:MAG TPA: RsiV family protein [Rectinemataceae bacterium]
MKYAIDDTRQRTHCTELSKTGKGFLSTRAIGTGVLGWIGLSFLFLVFSVFLFSCEGRAESPIASAGTIAIYGDMDGGGPSFILHRWEKDAWGFLEWPERKVYCLIEATAIGKDVYKGRVLAGIPPSAPRLATRGSALSLRLAGRGSVLDLEFAGEAVASLSMERTESAGRTLPGLWGYRAGPGERYSAALMVDPGRAAGGIWDRWLRRGASPREYASRLFSQAEARGRGERLGERQTLVSLEKGYVSILGTRMRELGSAHERSTVAMTASAQGEEAGSGALKPLRAEDVFVEGWEKAVAPLLREEALRIFGLVPDETAERADAEGGTGSSAGAASPSLRELGFFDEELRPSSAFFACRSGAGFHYNTYELGPAALGEILLVLPWNRLAPFLRDPCPSAGAEAR